MSDLTTTGAASDAHDPHDSDELVLPNGRPAPAPIPHESRLADIDPRAARRAERQVATMFTLAIVMVVLFCVAYVAIDKTTVISLPVIGTMSASNLVLGLTFGLAIFLIGAGAIHWAKKLMPDVEVVQERHDLVSSEADREEAIAIFEAGRRLGTLSDSPHRHPARPVDNAGGFTESFGTTEGDHLEAR